MSKKVLIIFGDAAETVDTLYPYFRLIEEGYEPVLAAPEKREYQMVMHQVKPGWTITREWEGYSMSAEIAFKDIDHSEYLGIFYSGGRAPEYIREDEDLLRITRYFFEKMPRLPVFATAWKFQLVLIAFEDAVWQPYPSVNLISKSVEVFLWMNLAWSMAT